MSEAIYTRYASAEELPPPPAWLVEGARVRVTGLIVDLEDYDYVGRVGTVVTAAYPYGRSGDDDTPEHWLASADIEFDVVPPGHPQHNVWDTHKHRARWNVQYEALEPVSLADVDDNVVLAL